MPNQKISQLPAVSDVQDDDDYVLAREGVSYRITGADLKGMLDAAVILEPAASSRNVIVPAAGDVIAAVIQGNAVDQTADLLQVGLDSADPFFRIVAGQAVGIGAGTFDPAEYGTGTFSKFVVSNGSYFALDPNPGPVIDVGANEYALPFIVDMVGNQTADGGLGIFAAQFVAAMTGTKQADTLAAGLFYVAFAGTKAAGVGAQTSVYGINVTALTDPASTADLTDFVGIIAQASLQSPNQITHHLAGVEGYPNAGNAAVGAVKINTMAGFFTELISTGRTVSSGYGIKINTPIGVQYIDNVYGVWIQSQKGAAVKSYGIYVGGGFNEFHADSATQIPLLLQGFTAQSANLLEIRDVGNNLLVAVAAAGETTVPDLKVTGLTGATAASRYVGATASGSPASGTFLTGDWITSHDGHVYICTAGGSPGTWATA